MVEVKLKDVGEDGRVWFERDDGTRVFTSADSFQIRYSHASLKSLFVNRAVAMNFNVHPLGYSVDGRDAYAVQTAAHLVGAVVKFSSCVKFGHDHLGSRNPELVVLINRDAAAVISDGERMIGMKDDFNGVVVPCQVLINGIVNNLPDTMVKGGAVVRVTQVHPGSFSNGFKAFQHLNTTSVVIFTHTINSNV